METNEIESRISVLEDIEAIKKLKATYCYLADALVAGDLSKSDELMGNFLEDAKGDYAAFGIYEGKEALTKFFKEVVPGIISFSSHMVHDPLIQIEGSTATGKWYFEVPCTFKAADRAGWIQGIYEEEYKKDQGVWKFSFIKAIFHYATPYDEGWVKTKMVGG